MTENGNVVERSCSIVRLAVTLLNAGEVFESVLADLLQFDENIEAGNHAANVQQWISQDGGQRVIELDTEQINIKAGVETSVKADVRMLEDLHVCNVQQDSRKSR